MSDCLRDVVEQVDISSFITSGSSSEQCAAIARSLKNTGAVLIHDPRVDASDADVFLDMMERYFSQPRELKIADARPKLFYQVGVTPDHVERPIDNSAIAASLSPSERPKSDLAARNTDPKWRFFWRCGDRPATTDFPELNAAQVIPHAFRHQWGPTMDAWGFKLLQTVLAVAEMLSIGLNLPSNAISDKMLLGPHLLAPTGTDLSLFVDRVGTTVAGYHYDINILTIHGRARFPGLYVWTRAGTRVQVQVPEGFLLVQSGVQLEYLTAGAILRGMHEVVISEDTARVVKEAVASRSSLWRVSSTFFAHVRSDASLSPLAHFGDSPDAHKYHNVRAGDQIARELRALDLAT